ncbi:MAG: 7-cyano-7-deazaguanine synthase, partial [Deltaproteobacteria bacterium]|nr:7-cyano-7-deazaguanine synthase [Deltaproteobacteria bacterium]
MGAICGTTSATSEPLLETMLGLLRHRGRAAQRHGTTGGAQLGVRAQVDAETSLPAAVSEDGRLRCVLDGRLFGSDELSERLTSRGVRLSARGPARDAELVANLFMLDGTGAFEQLDGAFALALATPDRLLLARDPVGEKPLYYAPALDGALLFASEVKALLAHPALVVEPDVDAIHRLLVFSFIPGARTMFRGVEELQPGCWLEVDRAAPAANPEQHTYWHLHEQVDDRPEEHWVEQVAQAVRHAVAKRAPAEGKAIAFLSGGVDSSAVVALLAERGLEPICYSVGFGRGLLNELAYARMVTDRLGVEQRVLTVTPESFIDLLPTIIWSLDDPLCDCITVPNFLLAREAARETSLIFNGEGGDPLFGGPKNKFMILGEWYGFLGNYNRAQAYLASYHKFYDHLDQLYTDDFAARTGGSEPLEAIVRPYLDDERMGSFLNRLMHINTRLKGG